MKTTRVTVATRIFTPEPAAAAFRLAALASALADAGADVTVLTTTNPTRAVGARAAKEPSGVTVRRCPVLRDRTGYVRGYLQYLSFDVPLFFRLLVGARPNVVVAEPPPTTGLVVRLACTLRRVPYVYYAADIWSDASAQAAPGIVVRLLRAVESFVLRGASRVIAVTDGVGDRVKELGAHDVVIVRNGIDTDAFTPDGPVHSDAPDGPYAIYAGTTSEWQGADVFVDAMTSVLERVTDAQLIYLGQGSAWEHIAAAAERLPDGGKSVRMLTPVGPREASAWLRGANAALVSLKPGQGYDFAFPTKVLAGLASGTPVLYAGPGRASEVIREHRLGRAVDHRLEAVADAMCEMLADDVATAERRRLAAWVEETSSLRQTAARAAQVVLVACRLEQPEVTR
ncbi:MAG: glycosyltransferase family 4 protein [Promicromonosporaceae bacterium]|nr:glycosyltransferase family 4 protein [Promicromonosporaceae bacterium]